MKTGAAIGMIAAALSWSGVAAETGACEVLKTGVFAPLVQEGRLCSGQDIGRLIGT